jgi:aspartyl-tRNA(Asn)/glutamyl-tRNA(Gln) amidotransferase subunit B
MASIRYICEAVEHEIIRQIETLDSGGKIIQETRLFDEGKGITSPMRSKEDAPDYRYFPDPDLVEVEIEESIIRKIQMDMPELPDQRRTRLIKEFNVSEQEAAILTKDKRISDFFESCSKYCGDKTRLGRWITKDLFKLLNESSISIRHLPFTAQAFAGLVNLISSGRITDPMARTVLEDMFRTGKDPERIIQERDLRPIENSSQLYGIIDGVFDEHPDVVSKIHDGNTKPIGYLIGQVMKRTGGKANPKKVNELIRKRLLT